MKSIDNFLPDFQLFNESGVFTIEEDYHGIHSTIYDSLRGNFAEEIDFYLSLIPPQAAVAELGCGTGCLSIPLAPKCRYFLAIDKSNDMLDILRKKMVKNSLPGVIDIKNADFCDFELAKEGIFDLIMIPYNSLIHIRTPGKHLKLFRNCAKALNRGGYIVVDLWTPNMCKVEPCQRCSFLSSKNGNLLMYSQEKIIAGKTRVLNMAIIYLDSAKKPVLTSSIEYVFKRSEVRQLFLDSNLKVSKLPSNHPLINEQKRRLIYIGEKK